jgi:anti-anti-sigma regulatory factor
LHKGVGEMVRITCTTAPDGTPTMKVEGRLVDAAIGELARTANAVVDRGERVRLELSGVSFTDEAGADLLRQLVRRGALLEGESVFLRSAIYGG